METAYVAHSNRYGSRARAERFDVRDFNAPLSSSSAVGRWKIRRTQYTYRELSGTRRETDRVRYLYRYKTDERARKRYEKARSSDKCKREISASTADATTRLPNLVIGYIRDPRADVHA